MPFDILPREAGLSATAYAALVNLYANAGHHPSDPQWSAIRDLLAHLERAANGALEPALYMSALPAGTGKSTAVSAFAHALLSSPDHRHTGMLILVNRIAEAEDMARELVAHRDRLCVYTKTERNHITSLGDHVTADCAQLVISTQSYLKTTLRKQQGVAFNDIARYHYRGARRAVIAWDESFSFRRPVTLDVDTVICLAKAMRRQSPDAADILIRWTADVVSSGGGRLSVPDFTDQGVNFPRLIEDVADQEGLSSVAQGLEVVSGDEAWIFRQGRESVVITHYAEIPQSLMPVIITDASAKLNPSYAQMQKRGEALHWLEDAPKTYRNMTLRVINEAASRSVYRDLKTYRGRDLIDTTVRYIRSVRPAEVLVVSYKSRMPIRGIGLTTIAEAIDARLTEDEKWIEPGLRRRVHHLTYGQTTATNDYRHIRHVILTGLNFLPKATGYAASGAALNLDLITEHPTQEQRRTMQDGMLMDATLQAILRGHARMGLDGDCGEMEAVVIQTKQTGIPDSGYRQMFPGIHIDHSTPLTPQKPLTGALADLAVIVTRRLQAGETELSNPSLYAELDTDRSNFRRRVKKPEWRDFIAKQGLNPEKLGGNVLGLRLKR